MVDTTFALWLFRLMFYSALKDFLESCSCFALIACFFRSNSSFSFCRIIMSFSLLLAVDVIDLFEIDVRFDLADWLLLLLTALWLPRKDYPVILFLWELKLFFLSSSILSIPFFLKNVSRYLLLLLIILSWWSNIFLTAGLCNLEL